MPRKLRVEYAGAIYHVMNRGDRREWLLGTYTARFNRRHKFSGHLFSGRYKALIVDGSGTGYLKTVCDYVHLNPVRARFLHLDQAVSEYAWSSWPAYLRSPGKRPIWLRVDRLLGEYGIPQDSPAERRQLLMIYRPRIFHSQFARHFQTLPSQPQCVNS